MPDQAPQNKNELASEEMRRKILQSTIEIIGTDGYIAFTASRLSQQAGISKGALYHHFANLDDVRMSALAFLLKELFTAEADHSSSFSDYLKASGANLFNRLKSQPVTMKALYAFIFQALVDETLKLRIRALVTQTLDEYANAISKYFPTLTSHQQRQVVLILDAYFGGAALHWFLLEDEESCLTSWEQFSDMLGSSLQAMEEP